MVGLSFCQLEPNDVRVATDKILLKGAAICGCKLPQTEGFAEVISDEITIFILEHGYSQLTEEEIFLSLRINARGELKFPSGVEVEQVQFSGNSMNIDYLSKVLSNYMKLRNILDRKFQNHIDGY